MAEPKPKLVKLEIALFYLFSSNFSAYFIKSDCMKSIANGLSKNINTVRRKHSVLVVSIFFFYHLSQFVQVRNIKDPDPDIKKG